MHIFFSGIGGTAIGPLAMIAKQAGYEVSGSDKQNSQYIQYLRAHGIENIHIGQDYEGIDRIHLGKPVDWLVYSSAVAIENADAPELRFCRERSIKISKRDELLNQIINDKNLKLVAVAGTHGKTTTTAMIVWLFKQLSIPVSYSVGAKIAFGEMGQYDPDSEYFVYEADEFDRNFLAFQPYISLITGVDWDHHEVYPTRESYKQAFVRFIQQSGRTLLWQKDADYLGRLGGEVQALEPDSRQLEQITLLGRVNRENAWLTIKGFEDTVGTAYELPKLIEVINRFPGLNRRFERITEGLYSDYAHTEEKIRGCLQMASEASQNVVVVYEPLTDRRQHFIKEAYKNLFQGVKKLYWVPSYLAREDPHQPILSPAELIKYMDNKEIAEPAEMNDNLKSAIRMHIEAGDLVVAMSGGGGGSLDEWLRRNFTV